jgi:hypothetical protein
MKVLKWIMKALVVLVTVITLIILFADDLKQTYNKLTWTPPMEIKGIKLGMTRSDVVFLRGNPSACEQDKVLCNWGVSLIVKYVDEKVSYVSTDGTSPFSKYARFPGMRIPFRDVEGMKVLLGEADLYWETSDFNTRSYTYLKWGVSFIYTNNILKHYVLRDETAITAGDTFLIM